MPWEYPNESMITVCDLCHAKLEFYKFLKKVARMYLLFELKLTIDDTEEVLEMITVRVKNDHYREHVLQYMQDIKDQMHG